MINKGFLKNILTNSREFCYIEDSKNSQGGSPLPRRMRKGVMYFTGHTTCPSILISRGIRRLSLRAVLILGQFLFYLKKIAKNLRRIIMSECLKDLIDVFSIQINKISFLTSMIADCGKEFSVSNNACSGLYYFLIDVEDKLKFVMDEISEKGGVI